MKAKPWLIVGLSVVTVIFVYAVMYMNYNNREVSIRNQITAQQKKNETVFDNTWKIIKQQVGVTGQYKEAFREIYPALMEGRYKTGGDMMKWVQESNPDFDTSLYKKLMTSIEAQRTNFTREQARLLDLKREHDDLLAKIPSKMFVGDRAPIEVVIVTSSKTTSTFVAGEENDVELFE